MLIAVALLVVVLGVLAAVVILHSPGNVSHPNLSFTNPSTTPTPPARVKPKAITNFSWPVYGFNNARTRDFDAPTRWRRRSGSAGGSMTMHCSSSRP